MSGIFSSGGTSTSDTSPWGPQQDNIRKLFDEANKLYGAGPPKFFPGQLVAGRNAGETGASDYLTNWARNQAPGQIADAQKAAQFGLNAPDLKNNPYVGGYAEAATRPIVQNLQRNVLPQLNLDAVGAGQAGSSRAGIAQGLATSDALRQVGDTSAGIYNNAYNQGLNTYSNTLAQMPGLIGLGSLPGQALSAVGTNQRQYDQSVIDADKQRFEFEQLAPWLLLSLFQGGISGNYGGTVTGENSIKGPKSPFDPLGLFGGGGLGGGSLGSVLIGALGGGSLGSVLSGALGGGLF